MLCDSTSRCRKSCINVVISIIQISPLERVRISDNNSREKDNILHTGCLHVASVLVVAVEAKAKTDRDWSFRSKAVPEKHPQSGKSVLK